MHLKKFHGMIICLILLFGATTGFSETGKPVVSIGLIHDGAESAGKDRLNFLKSEILTLLGSRYDIRFSDETVFHARWSLSRIAQSYTKLLANKDVQIIIGAGTLTSSVIARQENFPKPVILLGIIDPVIQGLAPVKNNTSGVHNLTYILNNKSILKDLATFHEVYPYKRVGFAFYGEFLKTIIPRGKTPLRELMKEKHAGVTHIPVFKGPDDVLEVLDQVDAVYISYLGEFEGADKDHLIEALNARGVPTFGSSVRDVRKGMLAAISHEEIMTILMRRISLNVEAILDGQDPSDLKVYTDFEETLTINMKTAARIGYTPKFSVLSGAELIGEYETGDARTVNLTDVMNEAMQTNLGIHISEMNSDLADKEISLAKSDYYPSLTMGANGVIIDEERAIKSFGSTAERTLSSDLTATQLIYSDQVLGNIASRKHLHEATRQELERAKLDVALEAATAYFDILRKKTNRKIQKDNVTLIKKNLKIARQRETIGYSGRSDVLRWRSQLATATTNLLTARQNVLLARYSLNRILNREQNEAFRVQDAALGDQIFKVYSADKISGYIDNQKSLDIFTTFFIREALDHSPELREVKANRKALSRTLTSLKRKRYFPTVSLQANHEYVVSRGGEGSDVPGSDPVDDPWSVGVNLTIPIFEGGATGIDIQKKRIELAKLEKQKREIEQSLEEKARSAISGAMVKMVNLTSSRQAADYAGQSLSLIQDAYAHGTVSTVELADAQNNALQSDLATINSTYEYLISLLNLERVAGAFIILEPDSGRETMAERFQTYYEERLDRNKTKN